MIRTLTRCLAAGHWVLLACALATLVGGVLRPASPVLPEIGDDYAVDVGPLASKSTISLDDLAPIWRRDLRQPLVDPPPKPAPIVQQPPPPPLPALPRLLATFVEADQAWGLFVDAAGSERVRPRGARIDLFEIVEITRESAKLRHGDRTFDVQVPKDRAEELRPSRRG